MFILIFIFDYLYGFMRRFKYLGIELALIVIITAVILFLLNMLNVF